MTRHVTLLLLALGLLTAPAVAQSLGGGGSGSKPGGGIIASPFDPFPEGDDAGPPPDTGPSDADTFDDDGPAGGGTAAPRNTAPAAGGDRGSVRGGAPGRAVADRGDTGPVNYGPPHDWLRWWEMNKFDFIRLRRIVDAPLTEQGEVQESDDARARRLAAVDELIETRVQPVLRELTASGDPSVRASAIVALAKLQDPETSARARELLQDGSLDVRRAALLALGVLDAGRSSYLLMNVADDSASGRKMMDASRVTDEMRGVAILAASLRGDTSPEMLIDGLLADPDELGLEVLASAANAAGLVGAPRAIPALTRLARDDGRPVFVRATAATALGRLGEPTTVPVLLELLDDDLEVRRAATAALGLLAHPGMHEVSDALAAQLDSSDGPTRHFSAISLGRIGSERGRAALEASFRDARTDMRPWLALGLGLCERAQPRGDVPRLLLDRLEDESNNLTIGAYLVALGLCGDADTPYPADLWAEILAALGEHLESGSTLVAAQAGLALGLTGQPEAVRLLADALEEGPSPEVQRQVALGLGILGNSSAAPALVDLMADTSNPFVASFAALGVGFLGDPDAVGPLLRVIDKRGPKGVPTTYSVAALGQLFDRERRPVLSRLASGDNYLARPTSVNRLLAVGF